MLKLFVAKETKPVIHELDYKTLEDRLGKVNSINLRCFTSYLKSGLCHRRKIDVDYYVVGSSIFKDIDKVNDIDLVVGAHDKTNLSPGENQKNCRLSNAIWDIFEDYNNQIPGMLMPDIKRVNLLTKEFCNYWIDPGPSNAAMIRPHNEFNFENGLPIHLIVGFNAPENLNPTKQYKMLNPNIQLDYNQLINIERQENRYFCVIP